MNWQLVETVSIDQTNSNLPKLIQVLLAQRGYRTPDAQTAFLAPSLKSLTDPLFLDGMQTGVDRLVAAFRKQERVAIYADFDLDGTSGLALLKTGLEDLGFKNIVPFQPRRLREGYGLHVEAIEALSADGCKLIISVDVGITGLAAARRAQELGIDLIITDHHLPGPELPPALAIINPNKGTCNSKLGYLSGAGVAFYFLIATQRGLRDAELLEKSIDLKHYLDFFSIGTLTDLVPVTGDNRSLLRHGLLALEKTKRPGLALLMQQLELSGRKLYTQDITFRLAPKLNALSRLDGEILPLDVFLADERTALERVTTALKSNLVRRQLQSDAEAVAVERAADQAKHGFVWVFDAAFHKGVIGLVATRLTEVFKVPAFVGSCKEGIVTGSCRLPEGSQQHLVEALSAAKEVLNRFGGHRQAAGFELNLQNAQNFSVLLEEYFATRPLTDKLPTILCDLKCEAQELTIDFCQWYDALEPFGTEFKPPIVWLTKLKAREARRISGGHLRLSGFASSSLLHSAIWFSPTVSDGVTAAISQGDEFEMVGTLEWNHFRGQKRLQMLVQGLRLQGASA